MGDCIYDPSFVMAKPAPAGHGRIPAGVTAVIRPNMRPVVMNLDMNYDGWNNLDYGSSCGWATVTHENRSTAS